MDCAPLRAPVRMTSVEFDFGDGVRSGGLLMVAPVTATGEREGSGLDEGADDTTADVYDGALVSSLGAGVDRGAVGF